MDHYGFENIAIELLFKYKANSLEEVERMVNETIDLHPDSNYYNVNKFEPIEPS